jgi:hypothetical protein
VKVGWRAVLRKCDPILVVVVLGREMGEVVFFMVVLW